jgi:hypothetical protein
MKRLIYLKNGQSIFLDYFSLFFNSTYPVNSIAKQIFWAEIYRCLLFFRAHRSLVAKQEGLTIVHFLNKLIVSCKEAVRFPFYRINWVSRFEEQRKIIKKNEEKNPKLLFVHVHVYA